MHWANLITLSTALLLSQTSPTTALTTARVWAKFYPHCPNPNPNARVGDLDLDEQFGTGLNVRAGRCQTVRVPLGYAPDVDHVSVSLDTDPFWTQPQEKCRVALHEMPGCIDTPLIKTGELKGGELERSECRARKLSALNFMWVKLDCVEQDPASTAVQAPSPSQHASLNATVTGGKKANSTAGNGRIWQSRRTRLSLLGP